MTIRKRPLALALALVTWAACLVAAAPAARADTPGEVVDKSAITLQAFLEGPEAGSLRPLLDRSRAVLILPEYIRAGIGIGGEGGTGVLLSRAAPGGGWGRPLFMDVGGVTLGPQLGVESSQIVLVILDDASLRALLDGNATFGSEASAIAGSEGVGVRAVTVHGGTADSIYVFSRGKGAYAGATLKGGRAVLKEAWNVDSPSTASTEILRSTGIRQESAQRLQRLLEGR